MGNSDLGTIYMRVGGDDGELRTLQYRGCTMALREALEMLKGLR